MRFPPGQGRRDAKRSLMTTFRRRVAEWRSPSLRRATLWVPQVSGWGRVRDGPRVPGPPPSGPPPKSFPFLREPQALGPAPVALPPAGRAGWEAKGSAVRSCRLPGLRTRATFSRASHTRSWWVLG